MGPYVRTPLTDLTEPSMDPRGCAAPQNGPRLIGSTWTGGDSGLTIISYLQSNHQNLLKLSALSLWWEIPASVNLELFLRPCTTAPHPPLLLVLMTSVVFRDSNSGICDGRPEAASARTSLWR